MVIGVECLPEPGWIRGVAQKLLFSASANFQRLYHWMPSFSFSLSFIFVSNLLRKRRSFLSTSSLPIDSQTKQRDSVLSYEPDTKLKFSVLRFQKKTFTAHFEQMLSRNINKGVKSVYYLGLRQRDFYSPASKRGRVFKSLSICGEPGNFKIAPAVCGIFRRGPANCLAHWLFYCKFGFC